MNYIRVCESQYILIILTKQTTNKQTNKNNNTKSINKQNSKNSNFVQIVFT